MKIFTSSKATKDNQKLFRLTQINLETIKNLSDIYDRSETDIINDLLTNEAEKIKILNEIDRRLGLDKEDEAKKNLSENNSYSYSKGISISKSETESENKHWTNLWGVKHDLEKISENRNKICSIRTVFPVIKGFSNNNATFPPTTLRYLEEIFISITRSPYPNHRYTTSVNVQISMDNPSTGERQNAYFYGTSFEVKEKKDLIALLESFNWSLGDNPFDNLTFEP